MLTKSVIFNFLQYLNPVLNDLAITNFSSPKYAAESHVAQYSHFGSTENVIRKPKMSNILNFTNSMHSISQQNKTSIHQLKPE